MTRILIVDDNIDMLDTLEHLFGFYDFEVLRAENGKIALGVAEKEQPNLIILDALMPVMNGFEACEKLKKSAKTKDIPVIFLSANYTGQEHRRKGLELGADDYILKPFNLKELIGKVNALLHRQQVIENLRKANVKLLQSGRESDISFQEVKVDAGSFHGKPSQDPLTGVYSAEFFEDRLAWQLGKVEENGSPLSILLIDVDRFGRINEIYGEQTGDYVLMKVANVILKNSRSSDLVFRLQKNRFGIILKRTEETAAFYEAEKIRSAIIQTDFFDQDFFQFKKVSYQRKKEARSVTVSVGLLTTQTGVAAKIFMQQAEQALQTAKSLGRNKTLRYSELEKTV